jgi:signal peptidase I
MSAIAIALPRPRSSDRTADTLRQLARGLGTAVLLAAVVAWVFLLRPQFLGGPAAYVLVSGISMEPTLHNGDLVLAHRQSRYRVGDTVVYRVPEGDTGAGSLIIHRIVGGSAAAGWIVQGDNKDVPDLWRPRSSEVVGAMWVSVPGAGTVLARTTSPFALASISTLLALFVGLPGIVLNAAESRSRRRTRPRQRADALSGSATALALTAPPRMNALPAPSTMRALPAPSPSLELALPAPAVTVPVVLPRAEIARPASVPVQLPLPARAATAPIAAREPASRGGSLHSQGDTWGEAMWTARDLRIPALEPAGR